MSQTVSGYIKHKSAWHHIDKTPGCYYDSNEPANFRVTSMSDNELTAQVAENEIKFRRTRHGWWYYGAIYDYFIPITALQKTIV